MKLSAPTEKKLRSKNMYLSFGGGFHSSYFLEDHSQVVGYEVTTFCRNRREPAEKFLKLNPNAELTGVLNDLGNERAVSARPVFKSVRVYNAKQVASLVNNGF